MRRCVCALVLAGASVSALAANPFATQVVSYLPGSNPAPGYTDPSVALGEPTRFTGAGVFPSAVTAFNSPFMPTELVSIGEGGSLTLRFDQPVLNSAANPFGVDVLLFGNAFCIDASWPSGVAAGIGGAGNGKVEVSADGVAWHLVPGALADAAFPTIGYSDLLDPYALVPGAVNADFTKAVNPALNLSGMTYAQILAAYEGSGGGTGVDIGAAGLNSIQFIRVSNPLGSGSTVEVDAVSVVPAPGTLGVLIAGVFGVRRHRRVAL